MQYNRGIFDIVICERLHDFEPEVERIKISENEDQLAGEEA